MSGPQPRRLYLDLSPGEARGVVTLDGRPERLLVERDGQVDPAPGDRFVARVRRIERGLSSAFLELGGGREAMLALTGEAARLSEGQAVDAEITAPPRRGKAAVARLVGPSTGEPRALGVARPLLERLQAFAPGETVTRGAAARAAAELAEEAALAVEHPLGAGATLAIEATRALVAIDVDVGGASGSDSRRGQTQVNGRAIEAAARLLRLKGLGGLVVFDLAGRGQDGDAALASARAAFAADMPGVVFGPVTRLGTLQLALPWRTTPLAEKLLDPDGRPSAATVARRLARALEAEAPHAVRLKAFCAPDVAVEALALRAALVERLGARFDIVDEPARRRDEFEIRADG